MLNANSPRQVLSTNDILLCIFNGIVSCISQVLNISFVLKIFHQGILKVRL